MAAQKNQTTAQVRTSAGVCMMGQRPRARGAHSRMKATPSHTHKDTGSGTVDRTGYMREGQQPEPRGKDRLRQEAVRLGKRAPGVCGRTPPPYLALCHLISGHRLGPPLFLEPLSPFPQASPTTEAQDLKGLRGTQNQHVAENSLT